MSKNLVVGMKSKVLIFLSVFMISFGILYANYINSKVSIFTQQDIVNLNTEFKNVRLAREEEKLKTLEHVKSFNSKNKNDRDIMFNNLHSEYSKKYSLNAATEALIFFIVKDSKKEYILDKIVYWENNKSLNKYSIIQDECKIEVFCNEYFLDYAFKLNGLEENYKKDNIKYINFLTTFFNS